jgi:hypothetical protein
MAELQRRLHPEGQARMASLFAMGDQSRPGTLLLRMADGLLPAGRDWTGQAALDGASCGINPAGIAAA